MSDLMMYCQICEKLTLHLKVGNIYTCFDCLERDEEEEKE
jgi:hypothetical protein